jgi:hypothetical protein
MVEVAKQLDFTLDLCAHVRVLHLLFIQNFDRDLGPSEFMSSDYRKFESTETVEERTLDLAESAST